MTRSFRLLDHDPEIDKFKTLWRDEHLKQRDLAVLAGLHEATVKNMFGGQTKRPRHTTFASLAAAMGYEYALVREKTPDYKSEIPQAHSEYKVHLVALKKKREQHSKKNGKKNGAK
jgi:transcriptional regulator with XRE-family HTH domain